VLQFLVVGGGILVIPPSPLPPPLPVMVEYFQIQHESIDASRAFCCHGIGIREVNRLY